MDVSTGVRNLTTTDHREAVCEFPLKPDAASGVTLHVSRCNEMVSHEEPEMGLGAGGTGDCLTE
jgi:hypothetical protein